jgi:hypothetical protein
MNPVERTYKAQQLFKEYQKTPMLWGMFDCAQMAARMAELITGDNPLKDWPKYDTPQQAMITIREMGFKSLQGAVDSYAKRLKGPLFAMAGDIVAIESGKRLMPALGVCLGPDAVLCFWGDLDAKGQPIAGTSVARRLDMQFAIAAWRVG